MLTSTVGFMPTPVFVVSVIALAGTNVDVVSSLAHIQVWYAIHNGFVD